MRVIGLGRSSGYSGWDNPSTLLDYEVAVLDFVGLYEGVSGKSGGWPPEPVRLNEPQTATCFTLCDRRRREIQNFLALGRLLVVHLPPALPRLLQANGNALLPLQESVLGRKLPTVPGDGSRMAIVRSARPCLAEFGATLLTMNARYRAYLDGEASGEPYLEIEGAGRRIGELHRAGGGWIVTIPDCDGGLNALRAPLSQLAAALTPDRVQVELPDWVLRYVGAGELELAERKRELAAQLSSLSQEIAEANSAHDLLVERKALVYGTGEQLRLTAAKAFRALGFNVEDTDSGRKDLRMTLNDQVVLVEVKGKEGSAAESDAAQLEKWVSEELLDNPGTQPKGVLLVNAWRSEPPDQRNQAAFPHQMTGYSTRRGHCLITGVQLLAMWNAALQNPASASELIDLVLRTDGELATDPAWPQLTLVESETD